MKRIHIICEGQTEETFVNEVLRDHLHRYEVYPRASLVGKPGHKGGCVTTTRMTHDIKLRLLGDPQAWCTTFFDFYGLDANFVGKPQAVLSHSYENKARIIEDALRAHVLEATDDNVIRRFIPYVQMYEFEGLLFSDPAKLASGINEARLESEFSTIRDAFSSPEEINDSRQTAPSKRILRLMPGYEKPLYGSLAAIEVGIDRMRRECRLFDQWVQRMETLGNS